MRVLGDGMKTVYFDDRGPVPLVVRKCREKSRYFNESTARGASERMTGGQLRAYKCPTCNFWHLSSKKQWIEVLPVTTGDFTEERPMAAIEPKPDLQYAGLRGVLRDVEAHVSEGKGAQRHGTEGAWEDQIGFAIADLLDKAGVSGGAGYTLGQAIKKLLESQRKDERGRDAELVSAIGYVAIEVARGRRR